MAAWRFAELARSFPAHRLAHQPAPTPSMCNLEATVLPARRSDFYSPPSTLARPALGEGSVACLLSLTSSQFSIQPRVRLEPRLRITPRDLTLAPRACRAVGGRGGARAAP